MNATSQCLYRAKLIPDNNAKSPREWCNVGKMVCWHRRYNLGDEQPDGNPQEWLRQLAADHVGANDADLIPDEHVDRIIEKHFIILPLFLYDHSGITMNCSGFSCPWDSGQVGYIYCTKVKGIAECGTVENAEKCLRGEVEVYDQYLTGDVYGFILERADISDLRSDEDDEDLGWEECDSCWGFYGSDVKTNGMLDHAPAAAQALLDAEIEYPSY